jgi:hypothetical protein
MRGTLILRLAQRCQQAPESQETDGPGILVAALASLVPALRITRLNPATRCATSSVPALYGSRNWARTAVWCFASLAPTSRLWLPIRPVRISSGTARPIPISSASLQDARKIPAARAQAADDGSNLNHASQICRFLSPMERGGRGGGFLFRRRDGGGFS